MELKEYAALAQMGGLLVFSYAVWSELRTQRLERNALDERLFQQLKGMAESIAGMVASLMADRISGRLGRHRKGSDNDD